MPSPEWFSLPAYHDVMVGIIAGEIDGWSRPSRKCDDLLNGRQIIVLGVGERCRGKRVPLLLKAHRCHWNQESPLFTVEIEKIVKGT